MSNKRISNIHDYQKNCIKKLDGYLGSGSAQRVLLTLPTGAGKTFVAAHALIQNCLRKKQNVLWTANKWLHVKQFLSTLEAQLDEEERNSYEIHVIGRVTLKSFEKYVKKLALKKKKIADNHKTQIYVSTVQTMGGDGRYYELTQLLSKIEVMIIDEAHWGISGNYRANIEKAFEGSGKKVMALTATPKKGAFNYDMVGKEYNYCKLVTDKKLSQCIPHSVQTGIIYKDYLERGMSPLAKYHLRVKDHGLDVARHKKISDVYKEKKQLWGKSIILCSSIAEAKSIAKELNCPALYSDSEYDFENNIELFRDTDTIPVMTAVDMLNDGVDIPSLNSIFLTYPTSSDVKFAQIVGRGTRTNNNTKPTFNFVDFHDTFLKPKVARILDPDATGFYSGLFETDAPGDEEVEEECLNIAETLNKLKLVPDDEEKKEPKVEKSAAYIKNELAVRTEMFLKIYSTHIDEIANYKNFEEFGDVIGREGGEFTDFLNPGSDLGFFLDLFLNQDLFDGEVVEKFKSLEIIDSWNVIEALKPALGSHSSQTVSICAKYLIKGCRSDWRELYWKRGVDAVAEQKMVYLSIIRACLQDKKFIAELTNAYMTEIQNAA